MAGPQVPRAWLNTSDGKTTEWKSRALRDQRRTLAADVLIAGCYLAGTNKRRVRRALAARDAFASPEYELRLAFIQHVADLVDDHCRGFGIRLLRLVSRLCDEEPGGIEHMLALGIV
jgi:hypothetical protein